MTIRTINNDFKKGMIRLKYITKGYKKLIYLLVREKMTVEDIESRVLAKYQCE
jgi:hypothetical protein